MKEKDPQNKNIQEIEELLASIDSSAVTPTTSVATRQKTDKTNQQEGENFKSIGGLQTPLFHEMTAQLTGQLRLAEEKSDNLLDDETKKKKLQEFLEGSTKNIYSSAASGERISFLESMTQREQKSSPTQKLEWTKNRIEQYQQWVSNREEKAKNFELKRQHTLLDRPRPLYSEVEQEELQNKTIPTPLEETPEDALEYRTPADAPKVLEYLKNLASFSKRLALVFATIGDLSLLLLLLNQFRLPLPAFLTPEKPISYLGIFSGALLLSGFLARDILLPGLKAFIRLDANRDSCATISYIGCALQLLFYWADSSSLIYESAFILTPLGILSLFFACLGQYHLSKRAQNYLERIRSEKEPLFTASPLTIEELSAAFSRGGLSHKPAVGFNRRCDFVEDFIYYAFLEDLSDQTCKFLVPIGFFASIGLGGLLFYLDASLTLSMTALAAGLSLLAPFALLVSIHKPLQDANRKLKPYAAKLLAYEAADQLGKLDAVMTSAHSLFPAGTVVLRGMRAFHHRPIDQSILDAASLLSATHSILRDLFMQILLDKEDLLKPVDSVLLEDGLGISAWVNDRHVVIGSRQMAENHNILLPTLEEEKKLIPSGCDLIYLAVSGELAAAFVFSMEGDPEVHQSLLQLTEAGIYLVVQTVDPVITAEKLEEIYQIDQKEFKILPARFHAPYRKQTAPMHSASATAVNNGSFSSYLSAVTAAKEVLKTSQLGIFFCLGHTALGILLLILLGASHSLAQVSSVLLFLYQTLGLGLVCALPALRRIFRKSTPGASPEIDEVS